MAEYEFRGAVGVRRALIASLRENLPKHIVACRAAWGLNDADLPIPVSKPKDPREDAYRDRPVQALDRWPLVVVAAGRRTQRDGFDWTEEGDRQVQATYQARVFGWVKAEGHDETYDMRDNFGAALYLALTSNPTLTSTGDVGIDNLSGVSMEFSEVEKVKGERWVAGASLSFEVRATETLTERLVRPEAPARDTVSGVNVVGEVLPFVVHPALDLD